jgi:hypothetical protein
MSCQIFVLRFRDLHAFRELQKNEISHIGRGISFGIWHGKNQGETFAMDAKLSNTHLQEHQELS